MDSVPRGVPVCNPRLDPQCHSAHLAGVGVALKVVQELGRRMGKPDLWRGLVDLASLGTVADRMPLRGENRALVAEGVRMINETPRPGIAASLQLADDKLGCATSVSLSFSLIPRLNAAGRMANAQYALDLLLTDDPIRATELARLLEDINAARREAETELTDSAEEAAATQYSGGRVLVLAEPGWHEGVKGIVASRLANKFRVPTILFTIEEAPDGTLLAHGSGRSVGKIDLFAAIERFKDLTVKFGGHKYAAGVTVRVEDIPEFRRRLEEYFAKLPDEEFVSSLDVDGIVGFDDLTMPQIESLQRLEPFGQDNPEPLFALTKAFISKARAVGASKNHLSFSITNGAADATGIFFHCDQPEDYIAMATPVDLVFAAQIEEWRGRKQIKLKTKDMGPASLDICDDVAESDFLEHLFGIDGDRMMRTRPLEAAYDEPTREEEAAWELPQVEDEDMAGYNITNELAMALLGHSVQLHQSQRASLESLEEGLSTLTVMATGRGKSLIFYVHAAKVALKLGKSSIFIFPLRALINDQTMHVQQSFARLGLVAQPLTGETVQEDRERIYRCWDEGTIDVLLTTPEFLDAHKERLSASGRVGFIAVDEAHHLALGAEVHRPVYKKLEFVREWFPEATILGVTATAPGPIADQIIESLAIDRVVTDDTVRQNLRIDDKRSILDKETYLATIAATGEKTVVYVNSRQTTIDLARALRKRLPDMAPTIAFYNAGISRSERLKVEQLFRCGALTTIIATSAFGEGIDIPDIRHVVLYHMPFSPLAYNQMAGRCGRDGQPATVHLLYGSADAAVNAAMLLDCCPPRDEMVVVYKTLKRLTEELGRPVGEDELLEGCIAAGACRRVNLVAVRSAVEVFCELNLVELEGTGADRRIWMSESQEKVDLTSSVRYCEGLEEYEAFGGFSDWLMEEMAGGLLAGINRPLLPHLPR